MKYQYLVLALGFVFATASQSSIAAGNPAAGKTKSAACAMCHGPDGKGLGKTPRIVGLDAAAFSAKIADFKTGKRKNAMMENTAKKLSDEDVADLAAFYSSL